MAKHTVTGALYLYTPERAYTDKPIYHFNASPILDSATFTKIVDHSFDIEIPEDFDPIPGQLAALNEKKRQLRLKLAAELADLDDRISKLSALTFEGATA
jgi:hypothetical protein